MDNERIQQIENKILDTLNYVNENPPSIRLPARLQLKQLWQKLYPNDDGWKGLIE